MSLSSARSALALLVFWLASQGSAHAQAALPTQARIVVVGCAEGVQERALLEQVRIELLSAGVIRVESVELYAQSEPSSDSFDVATLRIDFGPCQEVPSDIALGVADRRTGKHIERTLAIAEIPAAARARAIALSLVELLRGVWRSLTPVAEPLPPEPAPRALDDEPARGLSPSATDAPAAAEPPDRRELLRIEWMAMSRIYPQTDSGDLATSLSLSKAVSSHLRMRAGGTAAGGGGDGSNVHIFQGTGRFALALCSTGERPTIEVGTAWDVGWAQVRGRAAGNNGGFVAIGTVEATLRMLVTKGIEALVSLHGGYVLAPLTLEVMLDDRRKRATGLEGSVLGVGVGLAGVL